jgi:hypothetical protein
MNKVGNNNNNNKKEGKKAEKKKVIITIKVACSGVTKLGFAMSASIRSRKPGHYFIQDITRQCIFLRI